MLKSRFRFLIVLAVLGCGAIGVSVAAEAAKLAAKGKGKGKAPASTEDCKKDSDCVVVIDDCCSCAQGGKQRAIPKKQRDAYEKDRKKRCADTACTEMMSTDPTCTQEAFCAVGICELSDPPSAAPRDGAKPGD
jgi:hypothetical protein